MPLAGLKRGEIRCRLLSGARRGPHRRPFPAPGFGPSSPLVATVCSRTFAGKPGKPWAPPVSERVTNSRRRWALEKDVHRGDRPCRRAVRHFPRLHTNPLSRKFGEPKTLGTRAIRLGSRSATQWRATGETAPSSSRGAPRSSHFSRGSGTRELDYRLIKELWSFTGDRIAVRFAYEWHDDSSNWFRSYGNENWEFGADGLMQRRFACINDLPIKESERKYHWDRSRPRPVDHPGLSDLGL